MRISFESLKGFTMGVLARVGLDDFSRHAVGSSLVETSLRGVDSHGVRLLPHYANSAISGRKNPRPSFKFEQNFPSLGHLDGDNAFGHAAGFKAIDLGMEMARSQGVGIVAVSNSSHPGAIASMTLKAARDGYLAFGFTNADSLIQSHNGKRAYFGTNPICMAAPRDKSEPFCLDMATSTIPWNRVRIHAASGSPLPDGVAVDASGRLTRDASEAVALTPTGSYKGYGLAAMIEVLCGVYTGMAFGRSIPPMYGAPMSEQRKLAQFYIVLRPDGVISAEAFKQSLREMSEEVRGEPSLSGDPVMLPGDKEINESKLRMKNGIPLDDDTLIIFKEMSQEFGVELNLLNEI